MNMNKLISALIGGCVIALIVFGVKASITTNSFISGSDTTNAVYAGRWDALVPALQAQVVKLTADVSNLVVKALATTNITVIYTGPTTNLMTNSFATTIAN